MSDYKLIYSDYLDEMVPEGFQYKGHEYRWCESDLCYYDVESDESYYVNIPEGAYLL